MTRFARAIGIDYSGARTPTDGLPGLRVYLAEGGSPPVEVRPSPDRRRHWTRRGLAEWLVAQLRDGPPAVIGLDHGFSFPLRYFEQHGLPLGWPAFLDDFCQHWPTDQDGVSVDMVRRGQCGAGQARTGDARWRRLCDLRAGAAKSVFHFDVTGSVAKSTHAGLPWLRFLRQQLGSRLHFWPFDGWDAPASCSLIAEVYPSLWRDRLPRADRSPDQHDALVVADWLWEANCQNELADYLHPALAPDERSIAEVEGWILGVR